MELTPEEKDLISKPPNDGNEVKVRIELILIELQKREKRPEWFEKTRQFFHNFCRVVDKTSALVNPMLPQSAEYTVTFGLLVLLFRVSLTRTAISRCDCQLKNMSKIPGCSD